MLSVVVERATVVAITSGAADELGVALAGLAMHHLLGQDSSTNAQHISKQTFQFDANDWGIQGLKLEAGVQTDRLTMHTDSGRHRFTVGHSTWVEGAQRYAFGLQDIPGCTKGRFGDGS